MKKFMKKALSIALALVVMLSLAPVTVKASMSMTGDTLDVEGGTNTVWFDGDEKYVYTWTPETDGVYTFTFYETDWVCSILGVTSGDYGSFNNTTGVFTHEFYAGVEYQIEILNTTWSEDDISFTVVPGEGEGEGAPNVGGASFNEAVDVTDGMAGTIAATGMESTGYFCFSGLDASKTYTLTAMVNDPMAGRAQLGITVYDLYGEALDEATYSTGMVSVEVTPINTQMNGGMVLFAVSHTAFNDLAVDFVLESADGDVVNPDEGPVVGGTTYTDAAEVTEAMAGTIAATGMESTGYFCFTNLDATKTYTLTAMVNDPMAGRAQLGMTVYDLEGEALGETTYNYGMVSVEVTPRNTPMNGGMVFFAVSHTAFNDLAVDFVLEEVQNSGEQPGGSEPGEDENTNSYSNPEVITETGSITLEGGADASYWVQWNASADGVFTVTTTEEGAMLGVDSVNGSYFDFVSTGNDTTQSVQVTEGDEILFYVYPGNGTITIDFVAGAILEVEDDDYTEEILGEELWSNPDYYYMYETLGGETSVLMPMTDYAVTLYVFEPTETGTYTFTVSEGKVGYYGTNPYYPYNDKELTSTVTVNYTDEELMASIVIGVSDSELPMLTITRVGDATEEEKIPESKPVVSAPSYVFTGNVSELEYVNVVDKTEDKAVLGKDGYYHLNTVDGPIILVSLKDEVLALANATATGKVAVSVYEDGKVVSIINYNDVLDAYVASADKATGLYPLTAELMEIYKVYGEQQSWYKETGFVGGQLELGNAADAWMFACMYVPNTEDGAVVVPPVVVGSDKVENNVVKEEVLEEIIKDAVAQNKPVVVPTTNPGVTMTFDVVDLKDAEAVDLNLKVEVVTDVEDETVAKNDKITEETFVLKVEFSHEGELPATATITIAVPEEFANKTLYYYQLMEDGTLKYVCDAPVDANGNAKVTQAHCSDYVLLTEKIVEVPNTGDSTNVGIWFAVLALGALAIAGSIVMRKKEF